ncbi:MAG: hydrogenase maturation protease [Rhodocyclaceae bacterium]|nr:hydrogenase maturation protease [Rhodocyclaceae bacterium]
MHSILIFAWGNPSRGDDALGPLFVERIQALFPDDAGIECLTDFQLQVEHALDLQDRQVVLFVDASASGEAPFSLERLEAREDASFTSHALSPQSVLHVYRELQDADPPPSWLLGIRGHGFELGAPLSPEAGANLDEAVDWFRAWRASRA